MRSQEEVFAAIAEITGCAAEELTPDTSLELDLGLDSIKMMGLLNNIITQHMPREKADALGGRINGETIMGLQTAADLVAFLDVEPEGAPAAPSRADRVAAAPLPPTAALPPEPVAIVDAQYFFLVSRQLIKSISICASLRLRGPFRMDAAQGAWADLVGRHVNLRARFRLPAGKTTAQEYRFEAEAHPVPPPIPFTDIAHLDAAAREKALDAEFERLQNLEWDLAAWPLHAFSVFKLAGDEHELFLANEHCISDGLGNHVILREFMELYRARASGTAPQLPEPMPTAAYNAMVAAMNAHSAPEEFKAMEAFAQQQGRASFFWNPGGARIASPQPLFRNRRFHLPADVTAELIARTGEWRVTLNSVLAAAYVRTMAKRDGGRRPVILQVPTSGRVYPGADASNVVGCFAQNLSLAFAPPAAGETWESLLQRVHGEIEKALVAGIDRAQAWEVARTVRKDLVLEDGKLPEFMKALIRSGVKSNLYVPFTGHTHIRSRYHDVEVIDYRAGTMNGAGTLDILQEIFAGKLYLFANFDGNFFPEDLIAGVMAGYMAELRSVSALKMPAAAKPAAGASQTRASAPSAAILESLGRIAGEVCQRSLSREDMSRDMEAELGVDSLERIRIVSKILSAAEAVPDRKALFACRTLEEMAQVWAAAAPSASVVAPASKAPSSPAPSAPAQAIPSEFPPASDFFDLSLPEIPYLHIIRQAGLTPDAVAVTGPGASITYRELDERSNRIAHYLRSEGAGPGGFIGIMMLRGPNMLIGILAILKSGAAYVPVDPDYPGERIRYILGHAKVEVLITEGALAAQLGKALDGDLALKTLLFTDDWPPMIPAAAARGWKQVGGRTWGKFPDEAPEPRSQADDLMVVLYTSGSTGNPKGVALRHRGYMNRLAWHQRCFQLKPGERVGLKTSCCFDISVWELLWPLMVGGVVSAVHRETVRNPWALAEWMETEKINVMHFVPSLFGEFLRALEGQENAFPDLRWLVFSGEALPIPYMQQWIDKHGLRIGLANLYGPTEASIDVTYHIIRTRPEAREERIPIGKPMENVHLLVLDGERRLVPKGELGELCIAGMQIAVGYLHDPARTAEAFIPNVYPGVPGEFVYRTGDLARELPDGSYDYHGRIDNQVKIRGFRVELGEIEAVLNAHPSVRECAVLAVDSGDQKRLVAWLSGETVETARIREFAARRLAEYMVPHQFHWLDSLPKTQNGKLDRKALLKAPDAEAPAPAAGPAMPAAEPAEEVLPLGPAQRWLVRYFDPPYSWCGFTRFAFNQALDLEAFLQAYKSVVRRHPALRTRFERADGEWRQRVMADPGADQVESAVEPFDGRHLDAAGCEAEMRALILARSRELVLEAYPLFRVLIIRVSDSRYEFGMVGHHIVGDLLSSNIIFRQLWREYDRILSGRPAASEPGGTGGYPDYVRHLRNLEAKDGFASHLAYWKAQFPGPGAGFRFPVDHELGENVEASAAVVSLSWTEEESRLLLRDAKLHFESNLYHLLLAPLYRVLSAWTGKGRVVVSHRMSGRELGTRELGYVESVGDFAVNFPVAVEMDSGEGLEPMLKRIKDAFSALPMKGVTYDWIAGGLPDHLYPDDKLTNVRVNYLGNLSLPPNGVFEIRQEDRDQRLAPPDQKRTIPIEIHFSVIEGELKMTLTYSSHIFKAATMERLGREYRKEIGNMMTEILGLGRRAEKSGRPA